MPGFLYEVDGGGLTGGEFCSSAELAPCAPLSELEKLVSNSSLVLRLLTLELFLHFVSGKEGISGNVVSESSRATSIFFSSCFLVEDSNPKGESFLCFTCVFLKTSTISVLEFNLDLSEDT